MVESLNFFKTIEVETWLTFEGQKVDQSFCLTIFNHLKLTKITAAKVGEVPARSKL